MRIRHATLKDVPALAGLMGSIIATTPYYSSKARSEEKRKHNGSALRQYLRGREYYACLIAETEKDIVGFVIGRNEAGVFWLDWLGVRKDARRKGIAEGLMKKCEQYIRQKGVHKIWCDTRTSNKESVRLFRKLDYKKLGTFKNGWYRQDFFLWEKDL